MCKSLPSDATLAFKAGALTDLIKRQGDWNSEAYQKNFEVSLYDRLRIAKFPVIT